MEISFDRGTIVLRGPGSAAPDPARARPPPACGFVWDERTLVWRAPAHRLGEIVEGLHAAGAPFVDSVDDSSWPGAERIETPPLRDYQEDALLAWVLGQGRGIIALPTGAGKTHVALAAIARRPASALVIVPTRVMLEQWRCRIAQGFRGPIGTYGDGERSLGPITIATFESAFRHMDAFGNRFRLLVVDEVHHFGGGVRAEALEMCPAQERLGLTATPPSDPGALRRLDALVGPVVFELSIGDLVGEHLAPFTRIVVKISLDPGERAEYERLFRPFSEAYRAFAREAPLAGWADFARALSRSERGRRILEGHRAARRLVAMPRAKIEIVTSLFARHADRRTLVFTAENEAAYAVSRSLLVPAITCDIGRKERESVLSRLRGGGLRAVVSSQVLNEGIDVPEADTAIVTGGALGGREHVQRVGRLLRPGAGKRALVYEIVARGTFEERQAIRRGRRLASRAAVGG